MDPITAKLMSAAGAAADKVYVDDVFSTFLYEGDGTTSHTITNNIDISGEGGLVWVKSRTTSGASHILVDTERGANKLVLSNLNFAEISDTTHVKSFSSTGFVVGNAASCNQSSDEYASWTFRKCPGFFDIVTYTGNGSIRTIAHSLGSIPGSIWIKSLTTNDDWTVGHVGAGWTKYLTLNSTSSAGDTDSNFNDTAPTASVFTVSDGATNYDGESYVAYIFAHDDQSFGTDEDESIIKCGSYTCDSSGVASIDLGFEPQWVLIKKINDDGDNKDWVLVDNIRGWTADDGCKAFYANTNSAEQSFDYVLKLNSKGFQPFSSGLTQDPNDTYVYIAIRRPNKPPSAGTEVYAQKFLAGSSSTQTVSVSGAGVTDMTIIKNCTSASHPWVMGSRILGAEVCKMNNTQAGTTSVFGTATNVWDQMSGTKLRYDIDINRNGYNYMNWQFTRKPGFLDVVAYTGTGSSGLVVSHNLGVTPEFLIIKNRSSQEAWIAIRSNLQNMYLNNSNSEGGLLSNTSLSSSSFTINSTGSYVNASGDNYIAYLFATLSGISKIGTFSGTGNDINVDCGFTAGARFVLVKRTDQDGDWYVFDTERGIASGNDSYLIINSEANPVTNTDYIDPLNAGFTITSSAPAALNASGGTYLFLAIA